jgi:hypothetical protein
MATISRTICDVHLTRGEEVDATSRSIEMDGNRFRVDLCDSCYQEHIQPFVSFVERLRVQEPAEKVPPKNAAAKKSAGKRSRGAPGPSAAAIRKWAQEQGIEVSASGRVPREVREQYLAAH